MEGRLDHKRGLCHILGRDPMAEIHDLNPGRRCQDDALHDAHILVLFAEIRRQTDDRRRTVEGFGRLSHWDDRD